MRDTCGGTLILALAALAVPAACAAGHSSGSGHDSGKTRRPHDAATALEASLPDARPLDAPRFDAPPPDVLPAPPSVTSTPRGFLSIGGVPPTGGGYEYGPSIVLVNGTYYAFYCAPAASGAGWDSIREISSVDGMSWSAPSVALAAGGAYEATSVCDPSVVDFHGVWLLYHTCISSSAPDGYQNNRVCVAAADAVTGPFARYDHPIVQDLACSPTDLSVYCVGQPSALVHDDQVWLYYSEARPGDVGPGPGHVYLQTSGDGVGFAPANGGAPVWDHRDVDVKWERTTGMFFLVQGEVDTAILPWAVSSDGLHFTAYDATRTIATNPCLPSGGINHNPGIAGNPDGSFGGMSFVLYGSSFATGWGNWHLYRSDFVVNPAANDCARCVANSCDDGCSRTLATQALGTCAAPGGTCTGSCCSCAVATAPADCHACASGCVSACQAAGHAIGVSACPAAWIRRCAVRASDQRAAADQGASRVVTSLVLGCG